MQISASFKETAPSCLICPGPENMFLFGAIPGAEFYILLPDRLSDFALCALLYAALEACSRCWPTLEHKGTGY